MANDVSIQGVAEAAFGPGVPLYLTFFLST